ncbi:hypothetical protein [Plasmodium yoelii yoelii]|uniref:Uncharacterized protein n=1 Tax=Plasmodium yoelii yoelii TaxID=73239 RepID=Q7RFQ1_PLAYO|nr:hypothetical protein [Plasmodium yoelii yoelii]
MGSHERIFRHLIQALGASLIASSAYQKWPTWSYFIYSGKNTINDPERSFENNQLIGLSISLSPLNVIEMNDLHVIQSLSGPNKYTHTQLSIIANRHGMQIRGDP